MKKLYLVLLACFLFGNSYGQTRSLNKFINQHKTEDHAIAVNVPGWMLDIMGLSSNFIDDDDVEARELLKLSDKISRVRFLIIDDGPEVSKKDVNKLIAGLKKENFEDLLSVRSEGTTVRLLINERKDDIRNITAFINSEDATILMSLSGRFNLNELKDLKIWDYDKVEDELDIL